MIKLLLGTHAEIREFLIDYLDGQLPLLKSAQFRLHLLMCRSCTDYLRRYDTSVALARNFLGDPPPEELVDLTLKFLAARAAKAEADADAEAEPTPR